MGVGEEIKGKVKEAAGDLLDNEALKREGQAQHEKGEAETQADKERAKAKVHEAKAREKELEQDVAERAKD